MRYPSWGSLLHRVNHINHAAVAVAHHANDPVGKRHRLRLTRDEQRLLIQHLNVDDGQPGVNQAFADLRARRVNGNTVIGNQNVNAFARRH